MITMKIIVTGGAGFIASHITDAYIKRGHKVTVIDNLSGGFKRNINKKSKFYKTDIRDLGAIRKIFQREKPDIVNHHAAFASVSGSVKDPNLTYSTNLVGTANMLLAAGESRAKKFIFATAGGIYADSKDKKPTNERSKIEPLSPYVLSKVLGEQMVRAYAKWHKFPYLIFRYGNIYGPRQNPHGEAGVIAIFTDLICNGKQPHIFGDGTKLRDYVYVSEIAAANVSALRRGKNETLNFGFGKGVSDQKIFDTIAKYLNYKKLPYYEPVRPYEVKRLQLDASRAKKVLGWKPKISFEEGVRKYLEFKNLI